MKNSATLFVLFILLALVLPMRGMAQTPSTVTTPAAPASLAEFLQTLSNAPNTGVLPPPPKPLTTVCSSNEDCPTGELCCYPCGIDGCDFVCMTPFRNRCPFIA